MRNRSSLWSRKFFADFCKKVLTNRNECVIIIKLSHEREFRQSSIKKIQKNLKKLLTNENECDIITKSLNERTVTRILKIKQRDKKDNYTRN